MEEIRVKFLIDLFENRPQHASATAILEDPVGITRYGTTEVYTEVISPTPHTVFHHTTHDTEVTKTGFTLPLQASHTKNEPEERIIQVHKVTHELTNRDGPAHKEVQVINRGKDVEEQLKLRQHENEKLRNDLRTMVTKLESMEFAAEKLKKDHEVQRRESAIQLNAMNKKLEDTTKQLYNYHREKDELKAVRDEFVKQKLSNSDQERRLNEANAKIVELLKHVGEKEEQLVHKSDSSFTKKVQEELESERLLKFELVKKLSLANEKISTLGKQIDDSDKHDHKESSAYKQIVQELNREKRLRIESETRLNDTKNKLDSELHLKQSEVERERLINATLAELSEEKQARIEQEKVLNVTKYKFIALGKQLEELENELERTKKKLAKEKLTKRNQEKLLSDANRKLSGLCDLLDEKQSAQTVNEDDRDQMRVFGDEILFISTKNNQGNTNSGAVSASPSSDFPEVLGSSHPLANLHAGSQRPKRKKNHSPLSPVIIGAHPRDDSRSNSDSDSLIHL